MKMSGQLHALAALPHRERVFGTHWIGGWVDSSAGLDMVAKRKTPAPAEDQTLVIQPTNTQLQPT
jgi:hypothetical protein